MGSISRIISLMRIIKCKGLLQFVLLEGKLLMNKLQCCGKECLWTRGTANASGSLEGGACCVGEASPGSQGIFEVGKRSIPRGSFFSHKWQFWADCFKEWRRRNNCNHSSIPND